MAYYNYTRQEFESKLLEIVTSHGLQVGDATGIINNAERVYEVTTQNPKVRIVIYSSLGVNSNSCVDVGGDAVRINFYIKHNGKFHFKKKKKHQRIETIFKNIEKSIVECNDFVLSDEIKKWIYAVSKNE